MGRVIFHSDMNNFFASCECLLNPEIKDKPVAVCGDVESRRGIVLAKNEIAKKFGIKTCDLVWQAKKKCPELLILKPRHEVYREISRKVMNVYAEYTDRVQSFGLDEAWLDMSSLVSSLKEGVNLADVMRARIRNEFGLTASVGIANNKVFAKLGSDMKKPDATTLIDEDNYKELIWSLPAENMLFVGRSTLAKLNRVGIFTIGDIAKRPEEELKKLLGKQGVMLWTYSNGYDKSEVTRIDDAHEVKSVGHSITLGENLNSFEDAKPVLYELCDKVAYRLREHKLKAYTVQVWVRHTDFESYERQEKLEFPTQLAFDILNKSLEILSYSEKWDKPVRAIGVRVTEIVGEEVERQLSFFSEVDYTKMSALEKSLDEINRKFGNKAIQRASFLPHKDE